MSETVSFTRMDQGTREDYELLGRRYRAHQSRLADSVLAREESWLADIPSFDALPLPRRRMERKRQVTPLMTGE